MDARASGVWDEASLGGEGESKGRGGYKAYKKGVEVLCVVRCSSWRKGVYAQNRNLFWQGRGEKGAGEEKKKRK